MSPGCWANLQDVDQNRNVVVTRAQVAPTHKPISSTGAAGGGGMDWRKATISGSAASWQGVSPS